MSTTRDDILWNRYEDDAIARDEAEYEQECDAGYEGSFEQFRRDKKAMAARKPAPAPMASDLDDILF